MRHIYIASCEKDGGIYHGKLYDDGRCEICGFSPMDKPMYMAVMDGRMYVLLKEPYSDSKNSALVSCDINEDGSLGEMSQMISTGGKVACHLCVSENEVYCTNYSSGSISIVGKKTVTHSGHGINPKRQEMAHTHYISPTPDGKYLVCCDLGLDCIFLYDKNLNEVSRANVPKGHGVRHVVFSDDGKMCFAANELESTVSAFNYEDGKLTLCDTVSTLPKDCKAENYPAAIRYNNGRIYVSNRGHDSISVLCFENGRLILDGSFSCGGHWPRDFDIFGNILVCTNELSGSVTFFKLCDGKAEKLGTMLNINSPLCVIES